MAHSKQVQLQVEVALWVLSGMHSHVTNDSPWVQESGASGYAVALACVGRLNCRMVVVGTLIKKKLRRLFHLVT